MWETLWYHVFSEAFMLCLGILKQLGLMLWEAGRLCYWFRATVRFESAVVHFVHIWMLPPTDAWRARMQSIRMASSYHFVTLNDLRTIEAWAQRMRLSLTTKVSAVFHQTNTSCWDIEQKEDCSFFFPFFLSTERASGSTFWSCTFVWRTYWHVVALAKHRGNLLCCVGAARLVKKNSGALSVLFKA